MGLIERPLHFMRILCNVCIRDSGDIRLRMLRHWRQGRNFLKQLAGKVRSIDKKVWEEIEM